MLQIRFKLSHRIIRNLVKASASFTETISVIHVATFESSLLASRLVEEPVRTQEAPSGNVEHCALVPDWIDVLHYTPGNHEGGNVVTQPLFATGSLLVCVTRRRRLAWRSLVSSSDLGVPRRGLPTGAGPFSLPANPKASIHRVRLHADSWAACSLRGVIF